MRQESPGPLLPSSGAFKRSRCWRRLQSERSRAALGMSARFTSALATPLKQRSDSNRSPCCVRMPQLTRDVRQSVRFSVRGGSSGCVCACFDVRRSDMARRCTAAPRNETDNALLVCTSATRLSADPLCASCRAGLCAAIACISSASLSARILTGLATGIAVRVRPSLLVSHG